MRGGNGGGDHKHLEYCHHVVGLREHHDELDARSLELQELGLDAVGASHKLPA